MEDLELKIFTKRLKEFASSHQVIAEKETTLTEYMKDSVLDEFSNCSLKKVLLFLGMYGCCIEVEDTLARKHKVSNTDEAHTVIAELLDTFKFSISSMNKMIGVIYTPVTKKSNSLSTNTFLKIMDYFKCNVDFCEV